MSHAPRAAAARASAVLSFVVLALGSVVACPSGVAQGALAPAAIFGSNMVLQRGGPVPIFGTADPGATVTVQFQNQNVSAVADGAGKWRANLASMNASTAAANMTISGAGASVTFTGVQVGEVWLCSGQSNMGKPLSYADDSASTISDAPNHNIRLFRMIAGNGPATTTWQVSNSTTAANFSAVGYWMGLEISTRLNVPLGLIQATHDGTNISEWETSNGGTGADYLAMVKPIMPLAIKGVGWYQGESNGGDSAYEKKLTDMISEWRTDWGVNYPFGIVQLPSTKWEAAETAQFNVSQKVPGTWLVVTHDLPGSSQLHPTAKKPVGQRLGLVARGAVYGEAIECSGPVIGWPPASSVVGNKFVLNWTHLGSGLTTNNGLAPGPFQIADATGRFQTATATIVGNTIEVTSARVAAPKMLKYGYGGAGNLFNKVAVPVADGTITGMPASLFQLSVP